MRNKKTFQLGLKKAKIGYKLMKTLGSKESVAISVKLFKNICNQFCLGKEKAFEGSVALTKGLRGIVIHNRLLKYKSQNSFSLIILLLF